MTDSELLECIRQDDEKAFSTLFYRYSARIYAKAWSYVKDEAVCSQVVHDIFLTIWANRKTLEIQSFISYFTAAARYRIYKHISVSSKVPLVYKESLEDFSAAQVQNTGYGDVVEQDLDKEVDSYLHQLPKRCREIFLMSRRETMSNEEIARKLGISKRSVENQLTYALKYLRISLKHLSALWMMLFFH